MWAPIHTLHVVNGHISVKGTLSPNLINNQLKTLKLIICYPRVIFCILYNPILEHFTNLESRSNLLLETRVRKCDCRLHAINMYILFLLSYINILSIQ